MYLLERAEYSLFMLILMSISILEGILAIIEFVVDAEEKKQYLFTTSLIGATIQDRGKRKRSNDV